jgi:hypothetical protein
MKKLMILTLVLVTSFGTTSLQAQSFRRLYSDIAKLVEDSLSQTAKIKAQKKVVEDAQKKIDEHIQKSIDKADEDPVAHGANEELRNLKNALQKAKDQLEEDKKELANLEEKLKKKRKKEEEKLDKAFKGILEMYPIPEDEDKLDDYEKKMKELEINPRNSEAEVKLHERFQKIIEAKRRELKEQGTLPGSQNNHTPTEDRETITHQNHSPSLAIGLQAEKWFIDQELFSDDYLNEINRAIYADPEIFETLFETFKGEFFLGTFSSPPSFSKYLQKRPRFLGINATYWLNKYIALDAELVKGESSISAKFPITVINLENGETQSLHGTVTADQNYYAARLFAQCAFFTGWMRAAVRGGVKYQRSSAYELIASLGDQEFKIGEETVRTIITPSAVLAVQLRLSKGLSLEMSIKGEREEKQLQLGAGLRLQYYLDK